MSTKDTVADILKGSKASRIDEVTKALERGGVSTRDDLKYFDWKALQEIGSLSEMEISKIMRYVQTNFPEEYEEYKLKRDKEMKLKRETELITFKNNAEKKLQQEREEFERNILKEKNLKDVTRIHFYSDSMPENKRRKTEISLGRDFSSNHSWLIIQIILILVLLVTFVGSPVYLLIIGNGLLVAVYLLDQNGHWKICCVVYYTGFVFLYFVLYVTSSDAQQKELPSTSPLN